MKASEAEARPTPVEPGLLPQRHLPIVQLYVALFLWSSRISSEVFSSKAQAEGAFAFISLARLACCSIWAIADLLLLSRDSVGIRSFRPDWLGKCAFSAIRLCLAAAFAVGVATAVAHDLWSNGKPVPGWIKSACCGAADAHRLRPDQVRQNPRGDYVVQGYRDPIAAKFALPSADGDYWIFYRDNLDGSRSAVFCFFVPMISKCHGLPQLVCGQKICYPRLFLSCGRRR